MGWRYRFGVINKLLKAQAEEEKSERTAVEIVADEYQPEKGNSYMLNLG